MTRVDSTPLLQGTVAQPHTSDLSQATRFRLQGLILGLALSLALFAINAAHSHSRGWRSVMEEQELQTKLLLQDTSMVLMEHQRVRREEESLARAMAEVSHKLQGSAMQGPEVAPGDESLPNSGSSAYNKAQPQVADAKQEAAMLQELGQLRGLVQQLQVKKEDVGSADTSHSRVTSASWDLSAFDFSGMPPGGSFNSSTFDLLGRSGWFFQLLPMGTAAAKPATALALCYVPDNYALWQDLRLTLDDQPKAWAGDVDCSSQSCDSTICCASCRFLQRNPLHSATVRLQLAAPPSLVAGQSPIAPPLLPPISPPIVIP